MSDRITTLKKEQAESRKIIKRILSKNNINNTVSVIERTKEEPGLGVSAIWDKKQYDKIEELFYDIRKGKIELVQEFTDVCVDKAIGKKPQGKLVPKMAHCGHNVITHHGISLTNKNITGQDYTRFLYIFSGTDNSQVPTIYTDRLEGENARMSILDSGFYFASGTALFQGCVFPTSIPDAQVKAFGSATTSDPDDPLHTVFWIMRILDPLKYINHFQNKTIYTHMHVIDRRSRLSE